MVTSFWSTVAAPKRLVTSFDMSLLDVVVVDVVEFDVVEFDAAAPAALETNVTVFFTVNLLTRVGFFEFCVSALYEGIKMI